MSSVIRHSQMSANDDQAPDFDVVSRFSWTDSENDSREGASGDLTPLLARLNKPSLFSDKVTSRAKAQYKKVKDFLTTHCKIPNLKGRLRRFHPMAKARNAAFAEERAEVEVLYAQAEKHSEIGKKLAGLQSRLQGGGRSVQESIGPIHDNTREHQTISSNVDRILAQTDKMLEAGQDKNKEERIIRTRSPSKTGISEYVASMKRLQRSYDQMQSSNIKVQQQAIGDLNELLNEGSLKLQDHFRSKISERLQAVEPLHFMTKQLPFPTLSEDRAAQLAVIEKVISAQSSGPRDSPAVRIYTDLRASYLANSLQSMALATISTSKRKTHEEPYRQGTSAISTYASSMEGLFVAEYRNISTIFQREDWGIVLELTCRKPITEFAKTLRELNLYMKSNITTDCFLAFEILDIVASVSHTLSRETNDLKLPFSEALKPIRETARSSISELLEDQRRHIGNLTTLPLDGAASPFTAETMKRLQNLTAYPRALSSILASVGEGGWTSSGTAAQSNASSSMKALDVGADGTALQTRYILDTIDTHFTALELRAKQIHKSKAVIGVFISNTAAQIDRMIRSSDLASILSSSPNAQQKIDAWRKKGTSTYLDAWKEPCAALFDVQYTNRPSSNRPASGTTIPSTEIIKSLSSKDRDAIKEKFKHFNASFEEAIRKHREMMPGMEREVKSGLGREVGNMVEPLYGRFWDRYEAIDRGRGKYVRWDKNTLAALTASLE